jgi:hypothetical protein
MLKHLEDGGKIRARFMKDAPWTKEAEWDLNEIGELTNIMTRDDLEIVPPKIVKDLSIFVYESSIGAKVYTTVQDHLGKYGELIAIVKTTLEFEREEGLKNEKA